MAICFGFIVFATFELFLYLYHQYSKANVKQANPIPTNITIKTPPIVNKNVGNIANDTIDTFYKLSPNIVLLNFDLNILIWNLLVSIDLLLPNR